MASVSIRDICILLLSGGAPPCSQLPANLHPWEKPIVHKDLDHCASYQRSTLSSELLASLRAERGCCSHRGVSQQVEHQSVLSLSL